VEEDVYDMLTKLGSKNESFSDIVRKAVDYYKKDIPFLLLRRNERGLGLYRNRPKPRKESSLIERIHPSLER